MAGGLLACVGVVVLLARATEAGRADQLVAFGIFGLSLIAVYCASALYHLLPLSPAGIARLRRVDHMMIFVLIAGTYTPFCLLALEGAWRAGLLVLVWGLALCGILLKLLWMEAPRWLSVALYLGMGWVAVIAAPAPQWRRNAPSGCCQFVQLIRRCALPAAYPRSCDFMRPSRILCARSVVSWAPVGPKGDHDPIPFDVSDAHFRELKLEATLSESRRKGRSFYYARPFLACPALCPLTPSCFR